MSDRTTATGQTGVPDPAETGVDVQPVETEALPAPAAPAVEGDGDRRPVLELRDVSTHYGLVAVLRNVNVEIYPGEMVCLLGGNASGKTTTLKTMLGYLKPSSGAVYMDGENVNGWSTAQRVGHGLTMVPENRRLFKRMSVKENLEIGAYLRQSEDLDADYERVFEMFPRVKERLSQKAGTLSGGEQQMVAMALAISSRRRLAYERTMESWSWR